MKSLATLFLAAASFSIPVLASTYNFQQIVDPGDPTFNQALGINNSGTIAAYFGSGATSHLNKGYTVASPYSAFTSENFPGSTQTQVTGINNASTPVTVGFYADANVPPDFFGFVDQGGTFTSVENPATPTIGPTTNQLLGVNDNGVVVGFYADSGGNDHGYTYNISGGTFAGITLPSADNATSFVATGIDNAGVITGFFVSAGVTEAFLDSGGIFTNFQATGSSNTMFLGINNDGEAVGVYQDASGNNHGFVYNIGTGTYQTIDDPSAVSANGGTTINGINDNGQLVGFYGDANGNTIGFLATPTATPEPRYLGVMLLAALALAGAKLVRRKSRLA